MQQWVPRWQINFGLFAPFSYIQVLPHICSDVIRNKYLFHVCVLCDQPIRQTQNNMNISKAKMCLGSKCRASVSFRC